MITQDNEEIYDEQIAPLMTKIIEICRKNKIPMIATFNYQPEQLCTTYLSQKAMYNSEDEDGEVLTKIYRAIFREEVLTAFTIIEGITSNES